MKRKIKTIIVLVIAFLPITSTIRAILYKNLLGYKLGVGVKCKYGTYINCNSVHIGDESYFGRFSKAANLESFSGVANSLIEKHALIVGPAPALWGSKKPVFIAKEHFAVMSYWHIDVCSQMRLGANVLLAGKNGQIWTHGFDLNHNRLDTDLNIGSNIYAGSMSIIIGGISICDNVVISAGSVVSEDISESGVYGNNQKIVRKGSVNNFAQKYGGAINVQEKVVGNYSIFNKSNRI